MLFAGVTVFPGECLPHRDAGFEDLITIVQIGSIRKPASESLVLTLPSLDFETLTPRRFQILDGRIREIL
jgi:hypothetical protein